MRRSHPFRLPLGILAALVAGQIGAASVGPGSLGAPRIGAAPLSAQLTNSAAIGATEARFAGAVREARELITEQMRENGVPGLSIAVAVDGRMAWSEGFGFADLENRVAVDSETRFRIASISKALTSAALGKLVEEGRLDLDAPVQRYVPSFPEKRWPVTVRQVAGHIAGIRHYRGDEFLSAVHYDDVVDALVIFQDDSLLFQPGERYSYSTYGWNLISAVIQGAGGRPFLDYMRAEVIDRLGMRHTVAEHADSIIPGRARFYRRDDDGRWLNAPYVDNSNKWAGGGFLSTAEDMVVYGSSFLEPGRLLAAATIREMFTPLTLNDGSRTSYGLGWNVNEREGRRVVYHTGGAVGGSTILMIFPDEGVVVSILTNVQNAGQTGTATRVGELFIQTRN